MVKNGGCMALSLQMLVADLLEADTDWRKRLVKEWQIIVGNLHVRMRLERVVHDTVVIGVYEVHWMQELYMLSGMIMNAINQKLGDEYVTKLRFVVADKARDRQKKSLDIIKKPDHTKPLAAPQQAMLKKISDQKLQDVLSQLWYRCQA